MVVSVYLEKNHIEERGGEWFSSSLPNKFVELPKGSIKALIGRELSWSDEPVELIENNKE